MITNVLTFYNENNECIVQDYQDSKFPSTNFKNWNNLQTVINVIKLMKYNH